MKPQLTYIELKTGYNDNGPAWIVLAEFSKTGQTLYFDNKALKKMRNGGINANYYNIETGDEYWVSGVKKNGQNRHWAGSGPVMIDIRAVEEYLTLTGLEKLDPVKFKTIECQQTDKNRFREIENNILTDDQFNENDRQDWDKN